MTLAALLQLLAAAPPCYLDGEVCIGNDGDLETANVVIFYPSGDGDVDDRGTTCIASKLYGREGPFTQRLGKGERDTGG